MSALREAERSLPSFEGSYDAEIGRIYDRIVNRESFRYEPNSDPLYRAYRDSYTREGSIAMRDSVGQSAALTGGFSSSYAQSVGRQEYDSYLERLSGLMPQLYSDAYSRYKDEGETLQRQYAMLEGRADSEYRRYQDRLAAAGELVQRGDKLEQAAYDRKRDAYNSLIQLITQTGYEPSDEELEQSGLTREMVDALLGKKKLKTSLLSGYSGGAAYVSGGGGKKNTDSKSVKNPNEQAKLAAVNANYAAQDKQRRK